MIVDVSKEDGKVGGELGVVSTLGEGKEGVILQRKGRSECVHSKSSWRPRKSFSKSNISTYNITIESPVISNSRSFKSGYQQASL